MMEKYYSGDRILNCQKPLNFIIGNRSAGKSFYWKRYCVRNFIENNKQFVYVRRFKSDLDIVMNTWYDDISNVFKKRIKEFKVENDTIYIDGKVAGYCIAVTQFTKYKSVSMENVTTIFFDEFLPEDGKYIGGKENPFKEVELVLNFYQSVARGYNKQIRKDLRFIFVANAVTMVNPYFTYFNINKHMTGNTKVLKRDGYIVEVINQKSVKDEVMNTEFGKLISETRYGKYALGNDFYLDNDNLLLQKPKGDYEYVYTLVACGKSYGVLYYPNIVYVTDAVVRDNTMKYTLTLNDQTTECLNLPALGKGKLKVLKDYYGYGLLYFNNLETKRFFEEYVLG